MWHCITTITAAIFIFHIHIEAKVRYPKKCIIFLRKRIISFKYPRDTCSQYTPAFKRDVSDNIIAKEASKIMDKAIILKWFKYCSLFSIRIVCRIKVKVLFTTFLFFSHYWMKINRINLKLMNHHYDQPEQSALVIQSKSQPCLCVSVQTHFRKQLIHHWILLKWNENLQQKVLILYTCSSFHVNTLSFFLVIPEVLKVKCIKLIK